MKLDSGLMGDLASAASSASKLEARGFDGAISAELAHDPFFPLVLAAPATEKIELVTSIAVAFSRTPMLMANIGHDLNSLSGGRFVMGLGSQIQPHITKRFSMPWSDPAKRMREFISAMRAIWACWYEGERLNFKGDYYTHSLMTPMFSPTDIEHGAPRIILAAVGPLMTQVAGEVADGIILHAFTTEKYLREVTLPAIEQGLARSGRRRDEFEISYPCFIVTGNTEEEFLATRKAVCKQIAFYGSTPAYKPVLAVHGWGDLQLELNRLSKEGQWDAMGELITDEILEQFAVVGETDDAVTTFTERFGGLIDRTTANFATRDAEHQQAVMQRLKTGA